MKTIRIEYQDQGTGEWCTLHEVRVECDVPMLDVDVAITELRQMLQRNGILIRLEEVGADRVPVNVNGLYRLVEDAVKDRFNGWAVRLADIERREYERRIKQLERQLRREHDLARGGAAPSAVPVVVQEPDYPSVPFMPPVAPIASPPPSPLVPIPWEQWRVADAAPAQPSPAPAAEPPWNPAERKHSATITYEQWTGMGDVEKSALMRAFVVTIGPPGGAPQAARIQAFTMPVRDESPEPDIEPELDVDVDESDSPPPLAGMPYLNRSSQQVGESIGSGRAALVKSKGFGIAGPAAKAGIFAMDGDGKFQKIALPRVADTLRVGNRDDE